MYIYICVYVNPKQTIVSDIIVSAIKLSAPGPDMLNMRNEEFNTKFYSY